MKKACIVGIALAALNAVLAFASGYDSVSFPYGETKISLPVAKAEQVVISGSSVASGTYTISKVAPVGDAVQTNLLFSGTCQNGADAKDVTNKVFLTSGTYIRGGTATNGTCSLIFAY